MIQRIKNWFRDRRVTNEVKYIKFYDLINEEKLLSILSSISKNPNVDITICSKIYIYIIEIVNVYFAGRTLCFDVKWKDRSGDKLAKSVITMTRDSIGFFDSNILNLNLKVYRSHLTERLKESYMTLCSECNIKMD